MSWLSSLLIMGAVFVSGTDLPVSNYQNTYTKKKTKTVKKQSADETERFEKTYPFNSDGKIEISNINGSIIIEAWDKPEIYLEAIKIADSKERLSDVEIVIDESQSKFSLETDYKPWKKRSGSKYRRYGKLQVNFRLKVPRTAVLDEVESVNGSVKVSDMTNYTVVSAVNGAVRATNLRGTAKLSTVNGSVVVDFSQLNNDSIISLGTVNGSVRLTIPSAANATVRADTTNGSITNDFGLPVRKGKYVGRDLYGRIGSGDVKIKLNSVNGGLHIKRKDDGGTPNPAVNLLPNKNSDDFDDSFEMRLELNMNRVNKNINKIIRESRNKAVIVNKKEIEKAMKEAQKEMSKIKPKLDRINAEALKKAAEAIDNAEIEKQIEAARLAQTAELARIADSVRLSRSPYIVEKSDSFEVKGIPDVKIDADNCSVQVRGWNKPEISYSITRIVRNRSQDEPQVSVRHNKKDKANKVNSDVEIRVVNKDSDALGISPNRSNKVRVEVFVPKKSNLRIHTNKEIRLEGVSGQLRLFGQDNSINVRDADGELRVKSQDGMIRVVGFDGKVWSETVDGETMLEGNFKKIYSRTADGNITVTLPEDTNAKVYANVETSVEGFDSALENSGKTKWTIGQGVHKYNFNVQAEGKVFIRNKQSIYTN